MTEILNGMPTLPEHGSIKWHICFNKLYDASLTRKEKSNEYYLEVKAALNISESSVDKTEQNNIQSESVPSQETSLVVSKQGKHKKLARLDFSSAKGVVRLSHDCRIIDGDQAPTNCFLEIKGNVMQIKDMYFSNMINKVQVFYQISNLVILFQLLHLLIIFLLVILRDRLRKEIYLLIMK